jgi:hypothetical protein
VADSAYLRGSLRYVIWCEVCVTDHKFFDLTGKDVDADEDIVGGVVVIPRRGT